MLVCWISNELDNFTMSCFVFVVVYVIIDFNLFFFSISHFEEGFALKK